MISSAFTELFINQCVYNIVGLFIEVMQKESEAKSIFYSFQFFSNKNLQFRALTKTNINKYVPSKQLLHHERKKEQFFL